MNTTPYTLSLSDGDLSTDDFQSQLETLGEDIAHITKIYISNNMLTGKLPPLPKHLEKLSCANNRLTELSDLPNTIREIYIYNNRITQFPPLPQNLEYFVLGNTKKDDEDICRMTLPPLPASLKMFHVHVHSTDVYYNMMENQSDETKKSIVRLLRKPGFRHDFTAEEMDTLITFQKKHRKAYCFQNGFLSTLDEHRLCPENRRNIYLYTMNIGLIRDLVFEWL
jgi:hypothetical protein